MFYADHPLKPEPFVLVAYASCVGALGMKESTNMSELKIPKEGDTRIVEDSMVFGIGSGSAKNGIATTIGDPNYSRRSGNIPVFVNGHLLLLNIQIFKVSVGVRLKEYMVSVLLNGADGRLPLENIALIPQIRQISQSEIDIGYALCRFGESTGGGKLYDVQFGATVLRKLNFTAHAVRIAGHICRCLGVDLKKRFTVDKWLGTEREVSWLHLARRDKLIQIYHNGNWMNKSDYDRLYLINEIDRELQA